ncbi:MAG: hypothetical protein Q8R83_03585 [Legionellaceae bacterium]|nr:hypothetical protein [Legionellaceae bacterium]
METIRKSKPTLNGKHAAHVAHVKADIENAKVHAGRVKNDIENAKAHAGRAKDAMGEAMSDLLVEGKKYANELYEDGLERLNATEKELEYYADELIVKVRKNPLKAVLIAGGIGFLLSAILKK